MYKQYRVVGKHGQWGEIHDDLEYAQSDLEYCAKEYKGRDKFCIQERSVTEWEDVAPQEID